MTKRRKMAARFGWAYAQRQGVSRSTFVLRRMAKAWGRCLRFLGEQILPAMQRVTAAAESVADWMRKHPVLTSGGDPR